MLSSLTAMADVSGKALIKGKEVSVIVETNINTARTVKVDKKIYKIHRINATEVAASNGPEEVQILLGDEIVADLVKAPKKKIAEYFNLKNSEEVNCNTSAKGFIVLITPGKNLGNCIY
jgi:hypothetical protein